MRSPDAYSPLDHLDFLLSPLYDDFLAPDHREDLKRSALSAETIALQKIRSVPPHMLASLLGFDPPGVVSAYLIPYPDPRGGWLPHVRVKVFPPLVGRDGHTVKYLQPRGMRPRVFFARQMLDVVVQGTAPVYAVEGEKKCLSVAQTGRPAIGIAGVEGWHERGTRTLLAEFEYVRLAGRTVDIVPDSDYRSNERVATAVQRFAAALERRGAKARIVLVPDRPGVAA